MEKINGKVPPKLYIKDNLSLVEVDSFKRIWEACQPKYNLGLTGKHIFYGTSEQNKTQESYGK